MLGIGVDGRLALIVEPDAPGQRSEAGLFLRRPALGHQVPGEFNRSRVAQDVAGGLLESGIPGQLVIGKAHGIRALRMLRVTRGKNCDDALDAATIPSAFEVLAHGGDDAVKIPGVALIDDVKRAPHVAADAAVAVLPSEPGAEFQLISRVPVGPGLPNLSLDAGEAASPVDVEFPALCIGLHQPQE